MKRSILAAVAATVGFAVSPAAAANDYLESYCARLGTEDHFNSNGQRLDNVAAIIRQDRANFHAFGVRDSEDEPDGFFGSKANRARLEAMLRDGRASKAVRNAIVNGTPVICVDIHETFVNVELQ
jgi:hypothetical protein